MEILIVAVLLGIIPAAIAKSKGQSFFLWWLYGAALFIVALPHALLMKPDTERIERERLGFDSRKCPFCAEIIKREAVVCRYCGRDLPAVAADAPYLCPKCGSAMQMVDGKRRYCPECGFLKSLT